MATSLRASKPFMNPYSDVVAQANANTAQAKSRSQAKPKDPLPDWLAKKPRTHRAEREAVAWCAAQGIGYPYDRLPPPKGRS
jgi:hypothetical protein